MPLWIIQYFISLSLTGLYVAHIELQISNNNMYLFQSKPSPYRVPLVQVSRRYTLQRCLSFH
jgi:hypothetical protein